MKRSILLLGILGCALCSAAQADTLRWSMSAEQPANNYISRIARDFAQDARRRSQGQLDILVTPGSALYKSGDVKAAVARGDIQLGEMLMASLSQEDPLFELDNLPFLATDYDDARRLWQVSRDAIGKRLLKGGVRLLYVVPSQPQNLYSVRPLASMADFKGMRFGAQSGLIARMATVMGATPSLESIAQMPQAFHTGRVDGMLAASVNGVDTRAWDYCRYLYVLRAAIPKNVALVNEQAFQRMPAAVREALLGAAETAEAQGWQLSWALEQSQLRQLERMGLQVVRDVPKDMKDGLDGVSGTLVWEWTGKAGDSGRQVLDSYMRDRYRKGV